MKKSTITLLLFLMALAVSAQEKKAPGFLQDPNLSIGTKEFLKVLNGGTTPVEDMSIKDARDVLINAQKSVRVDLSGIDESERTITQDGHTLKLNIIRPKGVKEKLPAFIFIHGGGWVLGDYPTHKRLVRDLVVESGLAAVFVNYTPSPEAKFPQAINEIYAATKWVAANGDRINVDGKKLAIVGNSVGGNMTFATTLNAKEKNGPEIKCQILMWPVTDAGTDWKSWEKYGSERFLSSSLMTWMWNQYTINPTDRKSRFASPVRATADQLRGLPPTLIQVAENDILRDQGEALGRRLNEAGVDVATLRYNGVIHDWGMLNGYADLPETRTLVFVSAAFLKKHLK